MKHKLSAVLLSAALLSAGWLGITGFTLFFALVPLLAVSESYDSSRRSWWRMCLWGALAFVMWNAATIWWVWIASPLGPVVATVVATFWNLVALMSYHYISKRAPRTLAYTVLITLWIATEYIFYSAEVMTFPWLMLGHGFSGDVWAVQWYSCTGVFGGSLWVLLSNVFIFEALRTRSRRRAAAAAAVVVLPAILSAVLYFTYKPSDERVTVTVIQPDVPCYEKFDRDHTEHLISLAARTPSASAFALLPETAITYLIEEGKSSPVIDYMSMRIFDRERSATKLVSGATTMRRYDEADKSRPARFDPAAGWYDHFNSALLIDPRGAVDIYHKGRLVIGVEALPMKGLWDLMGVDLGGVAGQLGWGEGQKVFESRGVKLGPAICYEGLYADYFAGFVREGAQVMGVISNDGWWGDTPGHRRLFDFCRLRAVETRRAIARSANTGISGFITPRGDVVETLGWDEQGLLTQSIEVRDDITPYVQYGDWVARVSMLAAVLSLLYYVAYRVRRRNHLVQ